MNDKMSIVNFKIALSSILVIFLASCVTTSGVISKGNDSYALKVSKGDAYKVKSSAYRIAGEFCADQDRVIRTIKEDLSSDGSSSMAVIDLDFQCIPKPGAMTAKPAKS